MVYIEALLTLKLNLMPYDKPNVGANSIDGIQANVGITYLPTDRNIDDALAGRRLPTDPEEMIVQGNNTYSLSLCLKS